MKNRLSEGVIIPMALYGAGALSMRSTERREVNVLEINHLRSLEGVSRIDRVRNRDVHWRDGIERELTSRVDQ